MPKRAIAALAVIAGLFVAVLVAGSLVTNANVIDDVAWRGDPVPPCFVDATLCGGHILGTDEVGRDLLARLVAGAGVSLGTSLLATFFTALMAAAFAALGRFCGPVVAYIVTRLSVAVLSLPGWIVILAIIVVASRALNEGWIAQPLVALAAAAISWPKMTALLRESRTLEPIANRFLRDWASLLLVLSTVAFFGAGTPPPPTPSWGSLIESMEATLQTGWWVAVFPGLCIFLAVFGLRAVARYALGGPAEPVASD